jgi:hypothetical protein
VSLTCLRPLAQTASTEEPGPFSWIEGTYLAANICRMAKKPEPPKPMTWSIYKLAGGEVEAAGQNYRDRKHAEAICVKSSTLFGWSACEMTIPKSALHAFVPFAGAIYLLGVL